MNPGQSAGGGLWGLLRERWKWWVIPLLVMGALTIGLAVAGQSTELPPVRYDVTSPGG